MSLSKLLTNIYTGSYGTVVNDRYFPNQSSQNMLENGWQKVTYEKINSTFEKEYKEYLAIYTTNDPPTFVCEPILSDDLSVLREIVSNQSERVFESEFNYDVQDDTADLNKKMAFVSVRKLNKKI